MSWVNLSRAPRLLRNFNKGKHYRPYKHSNEYFKKCLLENLSKEVLVNNDHGSQRFYDINITTLNQHVLCKKKCTPGNQIPFLTKDLSKVIMTRSRSLIFSIIRQKKIGLFIYTLSKCPDGIRPGGLASW